MIRIATLADADAIAAAHIQAWRETYTDLLPPAAFVARGLEFRTDQWRQLLADPAVFGSVRVFVAEDAAGGIVGFAACGLQRASELLEKGCEGEVQALYLLKAVQGHGLGRALMARMAEYLIELNLDGMSLWTLKAAPACAFYEHLGGVVVGEREDVREEAVFIDLAYGWPDVTVLLA